MANEDGLGMDLPSAINSFQGNFDHQIDSYLQQWQNDLDDIALQSTINQSQSSSAVDAPLPSKIRLASGLFDIPLPQLRFHSATKDINTTAEQQLNRSYAIELNPNEKLGDFRLRVPNMAIEVNVNLVHLSFALSFRSIVSI